MSLYWKTRTLISGDYRELESNYIEYHNRKVIEKYRNTEEPIYCDIRLYSDEGGLFCLWLKALSGISYSIRNGLIPVIDMQTKENILVTDKERKTINAWEYFFLQPGGVHFSEIKGKKNVVILENPRSLDGISDLISSETAADYWRTVVKRFIAFSAEQQEIVDKNIDVFNTSERWLGVLARGTDYLNPEDSHPDQPVVEELVKKIDEMSERNNCSRLFVATEDADILDGLIGVYGDRLFYLEQKRYRGMQKDKLGHLEDYKQGAIEMNRVYLAAMYYLGKCDCLLTGSTTGAVGAFLFSESFDDIFVWNKPSGEIMEKEKILQADSVYDRNN